MEQNKNEQNNTEKTPVGTEAMCWKCNKIWNVTTLPANATAVKCSCGGYVVSPSGKVMSRPFYNEFDSMAPLLEVGDNEKRIITSETPEDKPKRSKLLGLDGNPIDLDGKM
jgi:hypothetical protein